MLAASPINAFQVTNGMFGDAVRIWGNLNAKAFVASFRASEGVEKGKTGDGKEGVMTIGVVSI